MRKVVLVLSIVLCLYGRCLADAIPQNQIGASSDDGHEQTNTLVIINELSVHIRAGTTTHGGFRFLTIPIRQGATINSAMLTLYSFTTYDDPNIRIYCEDNATPATIVTDNENLSSRTLTTAYVTWTDTNLGIGWIVSPDVSAPIQEVIDRRDWEENNNLFIMGYTLAGSFFAVRSWDSGDHSLAAKLDITYTPPPVDTTRGFRNAHFGTIYH